MNSNQSGKVCLPAPSPICRILFRCIMPLLTVLIIHPGFPALQAQTIAADNITSSGDISSYMGVEVAPHFFFGGTPRDFHDLNGTGVFTISTFPPSLWISNGFEGGTFEIPLPEVTNLYLNQRQSAVSGDRIYFGTQVDGGWQVWSSDGTLEGTRSEAVGSEDNFMTIREMIPYGDGVAFVAFSPDESLDRVYLINSNTNGAMKVTGVERVFNGGVPPKIVVHNDSLYTVESSGASRYLTTVTETGQASRSWQMPVNGTANRSIYSLTPAGEHIFMIGNDGEGFALWAYKNGSANRMFSPDPEDQQHRNVYNLTAVRDRVYFFSQPWNSDTNDFHFGSGLYYSAGNGTTRLLSEDLGLTGAQDALNLGMTAAGDYLIFTTPFSADPGRIWWRAGTTSASVQPLLVDGNHIGISTSIRGSYASVDNAAWITNGNNIFYTDGTSEGTIMMEPEELFIARDLGIVDGKPWFSARASMLARSTLWRIGEEIIPAPQASLSSPFSNASGVSLTPTLSWNEAEGFVEFRVQVSTSPFLNPVFVDTLVGGTEFQIPEELAAGTTYYWRVRVEDPRGIGEWSQQRSFTTKIPLEPPGPVTLLLPENESGNLSRMPALTWTPSADADSYILHLASDSLFSELVVDSLVADTSFTISPDAPLEYNSAYWWRVQASNGDGASDWSDVWRFATRVPTGTEILTGIPAVLELDQNYPNPFNPSTTIRFALPVDSHVEMSVFDMLGRRVTVLVSGQMSAGRHQVHFDASQLSSGLYIYRLQTENSVLSGTMTLVK